MKDIFTKLAGKKKILVLLQIFTLNNSLAQHFKNYSKLKNEHD